MTLAFIDLDQYISELELKSLLNKEVPRANLVSPKLFQQHWKIYYPYTILEQQT